jgi:23S rRNA G2069 N7-methylase RlmK/C1962 C5-methylase RlmI
MDDKTLQQAQMFSNRLVKRFRHLKKWAQRRGIGAFRLYDRDIPEIPLVLDYYASQPGEAALCGALYKRPYEKDEAEEEQWLAAMKDSAAAALSIAPERVFLKQRQKQKGAAQYEKLSEARFEKIVSEGDLSFKVNLSDYLDTGLFLDRRLLRAFVRKEASSASQPSKTILNLFSYTGSFSVCAAAGGAASTDSVDLSNTYLAWARENFSLNGMSARLLKPWDFFDQTANGSGGGAESGNRLIRADVLEFLEKAVSAALKWDIIVLDPPSFSNSKKMTDTLDLRRDYTALVTQCLKLLSDGGKLIFSANTHSFKTTAEELEREISYSFNGLCITDFSNKIIDEDFKDKKTPKTYLLSLRP